MQKFIPYLKFKPVFGSLLTLQTRLVDLVNPLTPLIATRPHYRPATGLLPIVGRN